MVEKIERWGGGGVIERKCWLPAFSPFPTFLSKGFFFEVVETQENVVKALLTTL